MQRALWRLSLLVCVASCSSKQNDTKIVVEVWSDLAVPSQLDEIRIVVKGTTPSQPADFLLTGKANLPVVLVLVPPDNQGLAFDVTATGYFQSNPIVSQTAHLSFVSGESKVLTLFLNSACKGMTCSENKTCSSGNCQSVDVDASGLPSYDPNAPLLPPDAGAISVLDGGAEVGAADVGGAEAAVMDAVVEGQETGDSAAEVPVDVPAFAPDSGADVSDGGGASASGGVGGGGVGVDSGSDAEGPDAPDDQTDVPVGGTGGGIGTGGNPGTGGTTSTGGLATGGAVNGGTTVITGGAMAATGGNIVQSGGTTTATGGTTASSAILSASPSSLEFGPVAIGQSSNVTSFTIANSGQQSSGAITLASSSGEFAIQTYALGDCISGTTMLATNSACRVRVVFTPTTVGSRLETVTFSATPGGSRSVSVTGAGIGGAEPAPELAPEPAAEPAPEPAAEPPPEPAAEPAPEPAPDAATAEAPSNCIQRFKANGYSLGTDASIWGCSSCKDSPGNSLEQICRDMIDCLQSYWPCSMTDGCWTTCTNYAHADSQGQACVETLATAACQ